MMTETLLLSVAMAVAAGLVGCFAVMRRMALAADALSHVALPGIGVALALHIHPIFGAAAMLFFGALLVWAVDGKARGRHRGGDRCPVFRGARRRQPDDFRAGSRRRSLRRGRDP